MARTLANIEKRHYRVMHRTPAAFSSADYDTLAHFTTFLATMTELGYCRDKTIKLNIVASEKEALDDGKEKHMGYNGTLEFLLNQSKVADFTAYETIENVAQDIFLYSEISLKGIFLPNAILGFEEAMTSGEVETILAKYEAKDLATKAAFRTRFVVPVA